MRDFGELEATARAQDGLLTVEQLVAAGFTSRQIDELKLSSYLATRGRGLVRLAGVAPSWRQDLRAATLLARPGAVASHRSALRLWGMRSVDDEVEITVAYPARRSIDGVVVHRSRDLDRTDVTWFDGIAVTTPVRTLVDAGLVFPEFEVERMTHHALATGVVTRADLLHLRRRVGRSGRNGAGVMGRILGGLPDLAEKSESGPEILLAKLCRDFGLPEPVAQIPIVIDGRQLRVDFGYPEKRVFLEYDGAAWHTGHEQIAADDGRQNLLVAHGWTPLRYTWTDLHENRAVTAHRIQQTLDLCEPERTA